MTRNGRHAYSQHEWAVPTMCSREFSDHPHIKPRSIHSNDVLDGYSADYLYLDAVRFINEVRNPLPLGARKYSNKPHANAYVSLLTVLSGQVGRSVCGAQPNSERYFFTAILGKS